MGFSEAERVPGTLNPNCLMMAANDGPDLHVAGECVRRGAGLTPGDRATSIPRLPVEESWWIPAFSPMTRENGSS